MRPTGWKHTAQIDLNGVLATPVDTTAVSEFATDLESDYVIDCQGNKLCMLTMASSGTIDANSGYGIAMSIWGSISDSQPAQKNSFFFNSKLGTVYPSSTSSVGSLGANLANLGLADLTEFSALDFQPSGSGFEAPHPVNAGTVAVGSGAVAVVGTETDFLSEVVGRTLHITDGDAAGQRRRINGHAGTTVISIDLPFTETVAAGASYEIVEPISAIHYWNRLDHNATVPGFIGTSNSQNGTFSAARTADVADAANLWLYPQRLVSEGSAGVAWVAVPCSMFKHLQLHISSTGDNKVAVFYNLIRE